MEKLTFSDLFKKSFLSMSTGMERYTTLDVVLNLVITLAIAMFIYYMYKKTFQGVLFQRSFNITLVIVSIVTCLIIMTISGNLILSLGMVGALSIIRFRTPIKDPIDLAFIFWAITVGIANGVGYYNISIIGSLFVSIVLLYLTRHEEDELPFLLVLNASREIDSATLIEQISPSVNKISLKSLTINDFNAELTFEIRLKEKNISFVEKLNESKLINNSTLISYSGDLTAL